MIVPRNILKEGERVVLREPFITPMRWGAACVAVYFTAAAVHSWNESGLVLASSGHPVLALIALVALGLLLRLRWVVTDRRVLVWKGWVRRELQSMRFRDIKGASAGAMVVHLIGVGRDLEVPCGKRMAPRVLAALGKRFDPGGLPMAAAETLLEDGERLQYMHPGPLRRLLPFRSYEIPIALIILASLAVGLARGGFPGPFTLLFFYAFTLGLGHMRRRGWWVLVTDRRLLMRRSRDPGRYDRFPITGVENVRHGNTWLIVEAGGDRYDTPCTPRESLRLAAAIERAKGAAA